MQVQLHSAVERRAKQMPLGQTARQSETAKAAAAAESGDEQLPSPSPNTTAGSFCNM